jgi:Reverse transcriptase (RNA-dependent DNA polymerase)
MVHGDAGVFMDEMGFKQFKIDHSVFYRQTGEEHTIVAIAMDNMAITSKRVVDTKRFKAKVKEFWDITDHRPIKWFLSFQIKRDRESRTISINQHAYIKLIVKKF